jgi:hypothetical protein
MPSQATFTTRCLARAAQIRRSATHRNVFQFNRLNIQPPARLQQWECVTRKLSTLPSTGASEKPAAPPLDLPPLPKSWINHMPAATRPYLHLTRIDKPIGTLLLFYPCTWSITLASFVTHAPLSVPVWYTALFGVGALVMRGAGCTINDLWDRNLDGAVARTKERPLARRDITPIQAIGFLGVQLSAGLAVLTQLNWYRYRSTFVNRRR